MQTNIDIRDHERDAMWQLVYASRAVAKLLGRDGTALLVHAQAVEDVLTRMGDADAQTAAGQDTEGSRQAD